MSWPQRPGNWERGEARRFHERTTHTPQSVRASGHVLDWSNRPEPFKRYLGVAPLPPPAEAGGGLDGAGLLRLLRAGAGVVRTRTFPGGEAYHFRGYASAGGLYPVELYAACARLPGLAAGLYHFHPGEGAMRRLRGGDVRRALAEAAAEPSLTGAAAVLVLSGILWRTAWKYQARGYRHLYWDAGTLLANLLGLAGRDGLAPRVLTGFVDEALALALGVDGEREAPLVLAALGQAEPGAGPGRLDPLALEAAPLSRHEVAYPDAVALHRASSLASPEEVARYRAGALEPAPEAEPPAGAAGEPPLEEVIRRRGSLRDFAERPVPVADLAAVLAGAAAPIPSDVGPAAELFLVANAVEGLEQGVYRFVPPARFELLRRGDFRLEAAYLCLEQPFAALAAATVFLLADLDRVLEAYGNRGYRAAQLEAGIRTGRIYLGAYARGLGAVGSTFYDDEVARFLAPGTGRLPMLAAAVGAPPRRARAPTRSSPNS